MPPPLGGGIPLPEAIVSGVLTRLTSKFSDLGANADARIDLERPYWPKSALPERPKGSRKTRSNEL
ncbi:MAG: hypothetical protein LBL67_04955 [Coriobacteriales bacterium]|jgi:hypothetical protein|nr:hypothetical protein [Coriobacteriales bacterium]